MTNDATSSLLDFSDESFNQFTEEIFNYSTMSDTSTNSFSNSSSSSSVGSANCLTEDAAQTTSSTSPTQSTLLYTLSGGSVVQSLNTLLGDLGFHLPTTATTTIMASASTISTGDKKSTLTNSQRSNENFEYSQLDNDCCNSNDDTQDIMTFKEFDNQLLSACFCTNENDAWNTLE